jgi:hypothetical protein
MRVTKQRMNETVHVTRKGMKENAYRVLMAEKPEGTSPVEEPTQK